MSHYGVYIKWDIFFINPLFSIGYMKVGTFDEKNFPSSRAVLVENYFSKCVPFHVFKFSFLFNGV